MSGKKYESKVFKEEVDGGSAWTAQILRRVSARKQHVSKSKSSFVDEASAQAWANSALEDFLQHEKSKQKKPS
ncbi:MAG: DUF3622 domain-containing protein [Pseudohongiellaceae bacterium]|nr:DUF3622 domain-containing protein [Pseudohongiellaceae bacterium]